MVNTRNSINTTMSDRLNELRNLISEALEKTRPMKVYPKQQSKYLGYVDFENNPNDPDVHLVGYGVLTLSVLGREAAKHIQQISGMVGSRPADALTQLTDPNSVAISKLRALVEAQELLNTPQAKRMKTTAMKGRA
jgi:hypothetical protein